MNNNDNRILELKKSIEKRRALLDGRLKFVPITTCILQFGASKINLHTLSLDELKLAFTILEILKQNGSLSLKICGFTLEQWSNDIFSLISKKQNDELRKQLNASEKKLNELLSDDKRTELELDAIAALLK